ncbi:MAG: dihydroorotase [Clostridia bacterium]|nr:dihydroorotase [Clostridia bacterium]
MKTLLKNGTVINYADNFQGISDILIENEKIIKVEKNIEEKADKTIDCSGLYIMPGMIDMHCHLREPGGEHKETIETGTASAVKGGFTTICPMPNTKPTPDSAIILSQIIEKAKKANKCNVYPYSSVTKGEKGEELVNFEEQLKSGAIAFSDDGMPVENARIVREAMIKTNKLGSFISEHCEEKSVSSGAINEGIIAEKLKVEGVLPEAEEIMAARDIVIAETNKLHTHICHISTKTTVGTIRSAKQRGVKVTCETCPHYYSFTEGEVLKKGTNAKMNPPLRKEEDKKAIIEGLKDGTIDCIVTDHAPHTKEEKSQELSKAPNGIIGFETALAATITNLVIPGHISYLDMSRLMSYNPAKILKLTNKGEIAKGKDADLTIFDKEQEYIYKESDIVSKSKNSPWIGEKLKGRVKYTIVSGKIVYQDKVQN